VADAFQLAAVEPSLLDVLHDACGSRDARIVFPSGAPLRKGTTRERPDGDDALVGSDAPTWARPASRVAMMSTPKNEFTTDPRPPMRLVPPMTTAAIAESSRPTPAFGSDEPSRNSLERRLQLN